MDALETRMDPLWQYTHQALVWYTTLRIRGRREEVEAENLCCFISESLNVRCLESGRIPQCYASFTKEEAF